MKSKATPTQRHLALLHRRGSWSEKVEQRLTFRGFVTGDLMECIDIIAVREGEIVGIQSTSRSNVAPWRTKALNSSGLAAWLSGAGSLSCLAWAKGRSRGRRQAWQCAEEERTRAAVEEHPYRIAGMMQAASPTLGTPW